MWVELSSYPLPHGDDAEVHAVVSVLRDVTEYRAATQALRFQAMLLDEVGQSVVATDVDGRITYCNRASERIFGWRAAEVLGTDVAASAVFDVERYAEMRDRATRNESWSGDFWSRRRDGSRSRCC